MIGNTDIAHALLIVVVPHFAARWYTHPVYLQNLIKFQCPGLENASYSLDVEVLIAFKLSIKLLRNCSLKDKGENNQNSNIETYGKNCNSHIMCKMILF